MHFTPMQRQKAEQIVHCRYPEPYDIYNIYFMKESIKETVDIFVDPYQAYYEIYDKTYTFLGFCCFGNDGQVPGGDYCTDALDIGLGLDPAFTGKWAGHSVLSSLIEFGNERFAPPNFRANIADFNHRATHLVKNVGFNRIQMFKKRHDELNYSVFIKKSFE